MLPGWGFFKDGTWDLARAHALGTPTAPGQLCGVYLSAFPGSEGGVSSADKAPTPSSPHTICPVTRWCEQGVRGCLLLSLPWGGGFGGLADSGALVHSTL